VQAAIERHFEGWERFSGRASLTREILAYLHRRWTSWGRR
jgi:hypothetical protein